MKSASDVAIFYKQSTRGHVILMMAVDNLTITATKQSILDEIEVKTITISQPAYTKRIIESTRFKNIFYTFRF